MPEVEFKLTENFLSKYKGKQPKWGPLGYVTFKRTYARPLSESGKRTEEFWQTLQRVVEGCFKIQKKHCKEYVLPWNERKAQLSAQEMFRRMWDFKFLPPGRGLWAMGTEFVDKMGGAALNNCGFISTADISNDFSGPFTWLMTMSMYGVGIGYDTEGAYGKEVFLKEPRRTTDTHFVEDSREGWVAAFQRILDSYAGSDSMPNIWDFSKIRPAGEPIRGFGGIAPGPAPLEALLARTEKYLNRYVEEGKPVDSTCIVDLMNFAGAAVVAGGIRRTAEIAFGRMTDIDFLSLKEVDNLENPNLSRWASNNSIIANIGDYYGTHANQTAINGEPGYFWLENARKYGRMKDGINNKDYRVMGTNPCGEQSLESFELCNLVETFPSNHTNLDDYLQTLKYAYLYAKVVTLVKTHDPRTNQVMLRNRRIGLSQSGIIENINRIGFREHMQWCEEGYQSVCRWDKVYSEWLGIPESIKKTTVKPSGTVSLLPGVTPGIHHPHSEYYLRRMRIAKTSNLWKALEEAGYPVEPDVKEPDYTMVVSFPVAEPFFNRRKADVSMWEQFELAAQMQSEWSDNQVSITITFTEKEAKDIPLALAIYENRLKSVSLMPLRDHEYKQAVYEDIDLETFNEIHKKLKKPKLVIEEEDRVLEKFCEGDTCLINPQQN